MAEAGKEPPAPSGSFWDGLLRNQYQQLKALELAAMGKASAAINGSVCCTLRQSRACSICFLHQIPRPGSLLLQAAPCSKHLNFVLYKELDLRMMPGAHLAYSTVIRTV